MKYRIFVLVLLVGSFVATTAMAQSRIAVLPLDASEGSRSVATRMAELLNAGGRDVVFGDPVFIEVAEHRVKPDPDVALEFSGVSEQIAEGINQFFYAGHTESLKLLSPIIQRGIQHFDYVITRPDLVAQLYEASLIQLRSYGGVNRNEDMKTTANLLARYFPTLTPSLKNSPPEVVALMRETKIATLEQPGAKIAIEPTHTGDCRRYLNGSPVKEGSYPVAPDTPVYVFIECDGKRSPAWRVQVPAGKSVVVPISMNTYEEFTLPDDSFESRRSAEDVMSAVAFWGKFDEVVGLRQPATVNTAPTLFGHYRQGRVTWTETRDVPAFVGFVEQTFAVTVGETSDSKADSSPTDWTSWAMVGGGILVAGGGGLLMYLGSSEATSLICSGFATEKPEAGQCDGVTNTGALNEDDFDSRKLKANVFSVGGASLIGAGLGLTVWGVVRMMDSGGEVAAQIVPTSDGFVWRFQ